MIYRPVILRPCPPLSLPSTRHQWNNFMSTLQYTYLVLLLKWAKKSQSAVFYPPGGDDHTRQMAVGINHLLAILLFLIFSVCLNQANRNWSLGWPRFSVFICRHAETGVYRRWRWGSIVYSWSVLFLFLFESMVGQNFQFSSLGNWLKVDEMDENWKPRSMDGGVGDQLFTVDLFCFLFLLKPMVGHGFQFSSIGNWL